MEFRHLLRTLGLSEKEAAAYLALLELGPSTVKPISERAGIKRTSIYNFIDDLVDRGLVSKNIVRGRAYYQAVDPSRLLKMQRENYQRLEAALPALQQLFGSSKQKAKISYLQGVEQIKNIVREEPRCKKTAMYVWPGENVMEMIGGADFLASIDKLRIANGIWIKAVRFREREVTFKTSGHGKAYLRDLRFAPPSFNTTMGVGIYDTGKVAFISSKEEGFGILIESAELTSLMTSFFNILWERSLPAREGDG